MHTILKRIATAGVISISACIGAGGLHSQTVPVYPLQVGDQWEYLLRVYGSVWKTTVVYDTLMPDGNVYAAVHDQKIGGYYFERQSGSQVYSYDQRTGTELLQYDFSRSPGDTLYSMVTTAPDDTFDVILAYESTATVLGRSLRQWTFVIRDRHIPDLTEARVITDSLGLTHLGLASGDFDLKGAVLNGIPYGIIADVDESKSALPSTSVLIQNHPNPFNPSTEITYAVPMQVSVLLRIYDMLGREVATLVNEKKQPGEYTVEWKAANVPSGVYFYRLVAGNFVQTKKMILLK